jgi:hypothetical protein
MAKKNKKPLLNEGTVRRMFKLANIEALGDGFISERYSQFEEEGPVVEEDEPEAEEIETTELETDVDLSEPLDEPAPEEAEDEVVISSEEAQDIIAQAETMSSLADKLRDAVGEEELGEPEADLEMTDFAPEEETESFEEEEEVVGSRSMTYEENKDLYEAALKGLNIELVDDTKKSQATLNEIKSRIYKRVISRLLKETKKE